MLNYEINQSEEDVSFIWDKIREYNRTTGPMLNYLPYEPFNIYIKNDKREILAGIVTRVYLKSMFVEVFWVDEKFRKNGYGTELLNRAEKQAKELGCTFIHLDTFSFQAIDFYKKCGYSIFGILEDYPDGIKRYFLKKYF